MKDIFRLNDWEQVIEFFEFMDQEGSDEEVIRKTTEEMAQFQFAMSDYSPLRTFLAAMVKFGTMSSVSNSIVPDSKDEPAIDSQLLEKNIAMNLATFASIFFEVGSAWGRSGLGENELSENLSDFINNIGSEDDSR